MEAFYRNVYPKAWRSIRNNYHLLFFGLFASILGFQEVKILFTIGDTQPDFLSSLITSLLNIFSTFAVASFSLQNFWTFVALIGLFLLLAIVLILTVASQGALIYAAAQKNAARTSKNFLKYLQVGAEKFWPLLGINVLNVLIGYFFVALIIEPLATFVAISNEKYLVIFLTALATFFILMPLVVIISFVTRYGAAYIMLKNQKLLDAFINGWLLFRANWLITVENAVLLVVSTSLYFIIMFSAMIFIFSPFIILNFFFSSISIALAWFTLILGAILLIFVFLLGSAFFGAFYNMVWSNIWQHLISRTPSHAKIHRVIGRSYPRWIK